MLQDLVRREFNRWADLGRERGMEKSHWGLTCQANFQAEGALIVEK
jgi:hypothetical protein